MVVGAGPEELFAEAVARYKARGVCRVGDAVVCVYGALGSVAGATNTVRVITVSAE